MSVDLLEKKNFIEGYLNKAQQRLSTHSFINVFAWQDFFSFDLKLIDDNLCVFAVDSLGCFQYLPPWGGNVSAQTIAKCFQHMFEHNGPEGISRIENVDAARRDLFDSDAYDCFNKGYEYCYYREDLVLLRGNRYKSQRSQVNKFIKNNSFTFKNLEKDDIIPCLALYDCWVKNKITTSRDDVFLQMVQDNYTVHERILKHLNDLDAVGRVLLVGDEVKGYSVGYPLTKDVFCILFEITDLKVDGLAATIFREFCNDSSVKKFKFINVMDAFEFKNIEKTKLSYQPTIMLPSYAVKKRKGV